MYEKGIAKCFLWFYAVFKSVNRVFHNIYHDYWQE